jgi:hypothetical protein
MTTTQDGWERYGGMLTRAMAEVLPEFPDEVFPEFPDEVLPEFPDEVLLTGWPGQPPSGLNSRLAHSEQTQPTPLGL